MKSKVAIPMIAGLQVVATPHAIAGLKPTSQTNVADIESFPQAVAAILSEPPPAPIQITQSDVILDDDTSLVSAWLHEVAGKPQC